MARAKPTPKPLFSVKFDFVESLDNVAQEGVMLLQCIKTILDNIEIKPGVREILDERVAAFRKALSADE